ncbi:Coenzyme F420 hydrogenase/dehydrogenase, beta subunit C-terminal domain [Candidatus Gracilibacteria bacterium]|nr:Coenzyme F420 hydrogenase/dehydrogenase, beta subunit C-terminal domain [Candidatus Gracilibacteria bacterium]
MFLLPENFSKKDFCEGCSFLGLYNAESNSCILCNPGSPNEDEICTSKFIGKDFKYQKYIGYYLETIDAISQKYQMRSSSGGLITSLLSNMLEKHEVDYAVVVGFSPKNNCFEYMKVSSQEQLINTQRSAYYPISLKTGIDIINDNEGTCVITCIPSVATAIELLKEQNKELKKKIKYTIGLTYNSTKKREYTEYLCKKAGKTDGMANLGYISYRDKYFDKNSGAFGSFLVKNNNNQSWGLSSREKGFDWSIGLFQDFSSNFVDDHYAECADISVMDAWHKNYQSKHNGTSLAVIRNTQILNFIKNSTDIIQNNIEPKIILESQKSGIDFKNIELGIRLKFYKNKYGLDLSRRPICKYGKNPIRIIKVLLRIWISLQVEKKYQNNQKIEPFIQNYGKLYELLHRVDRLCKKINF